MTERTQYIPISEANTPRIRTTATLPFHLEDRIGLDIEYLTRLIHIAGFQSIKVTTDNEGETSSTVVQTVGFGKNGTAIAGKGKINKVPTYSQKTENQSMSNPNWTSRFLETKHTIWPFLTVEINNNEIKQRILQSDQVVTNPSNWAIEINKAIKEAVRKEGMKNLVLTKPKLWDFMWLGSFGISCVSIFNGGNPFFSIPFNELIRNLSVSEGFTNIENFQKGQGYRLSLFPGYELDRAIALQIHSRSKPIVVPLTD